MDMTHTQRGFAKIEINDTRGCICRVQRSSAATVDAVWIFCDDPHGVYHDGRPSPHLDAGQARQVAEALLLFADGADTPPTPGGNAMNTTDDLLAACESAVPWLAKLVADMPEGVASPSACRRVLADCEAAIAKAKEETP